VNQRFELRFCDTDGAIVFDQADMAQAFLRVVHSWPAVVPRDAAQSFARVTAEKSRWAVEIIRPEPHRKSYNPVNGICDLIVDLNWSRLRQRPELLCLHAAGVQMGDGLVVFPSGRRAGKSTLTAELARRGHRVFSDDVIAVDMAASGTVAGIATGIAPRLRLPLPPEAPEEFCAWVAADPGPANRQYKYLTDAGVAEYGTARPIAAVVVLDRVDGNAPPALTQIGMDKVLPILIYQNFGRFPHAGRILAGFAAMARDLPCLRLTYGSFSAAADFLEARVAGGLLSATAAIAPAPDAPPTPDFDSDRAPYDPAARYRRRPGFQAVDAGGEALVADASGLGIFRLGPGMLPIWHLLADPMRSDQIEGVLGEVFPDVPRDQLNRDTDSALRDLHKAGLIEESAG
jgi:hypothetical protein